LGIAVWSLRTMALRTLPPNGSEAWSQGSPGGSTWLPDEDNSCQPGCQTPGPVASHEVADVLHDTSNCSGPIFTAVNAKSGAVESAMPAIADCSAPPTAADPSLANAKPALAGTGSTTLRVAAISVAFSVQLPRARTPVPKAVGHSSA